MRPASSRVVVVLWMSAIVYLSSTFLGNIASAQSGAGSKRKPSQHLLSNSLAVNSLAIGAGKRTAPPPQTTDTWTGSGGTANWSNASNWNNGALVNGDSVVISLTTAATVDDFSVSIDNLTLSNAGDSVTTTGAQLSVDGTITNNGSINLAATVSGSQGILYVAGNSTLTGTGALVLENGQTQNFITGASGAILANQSTIEGGWLPSDGGYTGVGQGEIAIANSGTINANVAGGILNVDPISSVGSTNTGTLEATNGATLQMQGGTWTQTGSGTISAANGSTVALQYGVSITGGTLTTAGTGLFAQNNGTNVSLSNLTIAGNYQIQTAGGQAYLSGTITNNGTISLLANQYGSQGILNLTGNTTLAGTGTVLIGNETTQNFITGTSGLTLTNNSTIEGGWNTSGGYAGVGQGEIAIANNGIINANVSGGTLNLDPTSSVGSTNTATLEATNGSTLQMQGGTWTQTGAGTISAATGSTVALQNNVSITGGTLTTAGSGIIAQNSGGTVSLSNVTLNGVYDIQTPGGTTDISNTITNNGTINLQANAYGAQGILYLTGNTTLTGSGAVVIGNETTQNFFDGVSGAILTNASTIEGGATAASGGFAGIGNGDILIDNTGTINANVTGGGLLYVNPNTSGTNINTGTMEATNGGQLVLSGGTWTNTGGTITAANGSAIDLQSGVSITGGTLTTSGSGVIEQNANGTVYLSNLTNAGNYTLPSPGVTEISGTITNKGSINLLAYDTNGGEGQLYLAANSTLTGTGVVVLGNEDTQNFITGVSGSTLTNKSTIEGGATVAGLDQIGNGQIILANTGTINANVAGGGLLYVNPGSGTSTNTGTLEATNGGQLVLSGGTWNNAGGTITAANGSAVILQSGVSITGGTLTSSGTGLIEENSGSTVSLSNLTNNGTYTIGATGGTTDISATITNNGTINLQATDYGNQGILYLTGNTTLAGTGTVVLANTTTQNFITGASGTVLTNDSTIEGGAVSSNGGYAGVGQNVVTLANNGTINANVSGGYLNVNPLSSATSTNKGTLEATNGGQLGLNGGTWTNTGGTISAATGSQVQLYNGVSIAGGTLTTSGTGVIDLENGQTDSLTTLTNNGTVDVLDGATLNLSGTITNNGTINVESNPDYTFLYLTGNTTLTGKGVVVLGGGGATGAANAIDGVSGTVLTNDETIEGNGSIGNGDLTITNKGIFNSNFSGGTLVISPGSGGFTNYNGTTTTLTSGTYIANPGNINYNFGNATGITTLSASVTEANGGQFINTYNNGSANALANLTSITSTGSLTTDVNFTDAGAFSNAGSLTILGGTTFKVASLTQISGTTLTAGTYVLDSNLSLTGATESITTNDASITLAGGTIENANSTNALASLATNAKALTLAGDANFTTAGNFSNTGSLTVDSGSTFTVTGTLTQYKSATNALQGGTFVVGGTLAGAFGANGIEADASNLTMEGSGTLKNTTSGANANGLENFNTIASTGSFTLADDADFTAAANFTNSGKLTVDAGSTFGVTGTLTNLSSGTLTGGTYTIAGTLQLASANGGITTNAATVTLEGTAAKILDGTSNALSSLANNSGTLTLASAATLVTANSTFTNSGTVDVEKGTTLEAGTGAEQEYSQTGGTTTVDGTLAAGGTTGVSVTGGTLLGAGSVKANVSNGATISAGDAGKAGLLTITGTYTQLSSATLNANLGGTTVGTEYSQLKISGTASLGGTLAVTLINSFTPTIGQTFTILTAKSITGTFTNTTIAINSSEQFDISYTSTGVVLTVVSTSPANSNKSQSADMLAVADPKQAAGKSTAVAANNNLRHAILGAGVGKRVEVAGTSNAPRIWEHIPATPSWDHVKAVTVAQSPVVTERSGMRSDLAHHVDNWTGTSHAVPVEAPLAGWAGVNTHRLPMHLLPTTLPAVR